MPVPLDRDPLHVDPGRRRVLVTKRILSLDDAPCRLTHPSGERVACLVEAQGLAYAFSELLFASAGACCSKKSAKANSSART